MFDFNRVEDKVSSNKYLLYLNNVGIDTTIIIENIRQRIEKEGSTLDNIFSNRSYKLLSTNIFLENFIFEEINKYLVKKYKDVVLFEEYVKLDIKTILSTQKSIIERPDTIKPSSIEEGIKVHLEEENSFSRIAKFETEIIMDENGYERIGQNIVFEGLSLTTNECPFIQYLPSFLIWENAFYDKDIFIIGFIKNFNSIESENILWLNSNILQLLDLKLDSFNNGLKALNSKNEIILEFRQWRSELIDNGASFVGQDSNISKLEGCDLILRTDYYEKLKGFIPDIKFYSHKISF